MRGTPHQIALAEWLVMGLDTPENWQTSAQQPQAPPTHEYRTSDGSEDLVRVFYLTHAATVRDIQEIGTAIRAITDTRLVFVVPAPRAMVFRGRAGNAAMAEWLFNELNEPANWQPLAQRHQDWDTHEYRTPDDKDNVVRVFYIPSTAPAQELKYLVTLIRNKVGIPRMLPCSTPRALLMRGTSEQIALAERLIKERFKSDAPKVAR